MGAVVPDAKEAVAFAAGELRKTLLEASKAPDSVTVPQRVHEPIEVGGREAAAGGATMAVRILGLGRRRKGQPAEPGEQVDVGPAPGGEVDAPGEEAFVGGNHDGRCQPLEVVLHDVVVGPGPHRGHGGVLADGAGLVGTVASVVLALGWSIFHILIVALQAYIFMMLTVVYSAIAHEHL